MTCTHSLVQKAGLETRTNKKMSLNNSGVIPDTYFDCELDQILKL